MADTQILQLGEDPLPLFDFARHDSLISLGRALNGFDFPDELRAAWDRFTSSDEPIGDRIDKLGDPIPAVLASVLIFNVAMNDEAEPFVAPLADLLISRLQRSDDDPSQQILADAIIATTRALIAARLPDGIEPTEAAKAARGLSDVSCVLINRGLLDDAQAAATSACNFSQWLDEQAQLELFNQAWDLAMKVDDPQGKIATAVRLARLRVERAARQPELRVEALDSVDHAIRLLANSSVAMPQLANVVLAIVQHHDFLQPIRGTSVLLLLPHAKTQNVDAFNMYRPILDTIFQGSGDDPEQIAKDLARLNGLMALPIQYEEARLALAKPSTTRTAGVEWSDLILSHPDLVRAVFHGHSFLRERNRGDLILTLAHEAAHVYSLLGRLGLELWSLRWAIAELELTLWGCVPPSTGLARMMQEGIPRATPLVGSHPLALALVERQSELELMIQSLQAVWSPWFEGIAIFGELHADPRDQSGIWSPHMMPILELWDRQPKKGVEESKFEEVIRADYDEAEALYAEAIEKSGALRLRDYLLNRPPHYAVGYLAVRSIVSAWRHTLGKPLTGAAAFTLLLHATRFAGEEIVPDSRLTTKVYGAEARKLFMEWLTRLQSITREDLDRFLDSRGTVFRWERGKLVESRGNAAEEQATTVQDRVARASLGIPGTLRTPDSSLGKDHDAQDFLRLVRKAYESAVAGLPRVQGIALDQQAARPRILQLGSASAPFWLIPESHVLFCLILTTEHHHESGRPSFDGLVMQLSPESSDLLRSEVARRGLPRIEVSRITDLIGADQRPEGANYLVFRYGEWLNIQPRGNRFGVIDVPDELIANIRHRMEPPLMERLRAWLTGSDHPAATRTLNWIRSASWKVAHGNRQVSASSWAKRVDDMATSILANNSELWENVQLDLTTFIVGTSRPSMTDRLSSIYDQDPALYSKLIELFQRSGRLPIATTPSLDSSIERIQQIGGRLFDPNPIDVVRPRGPREGGTS